MVVRSSFDKAPPWRPRNTAVRIWKSVASFNLKMAMVRAPATDYPVIGRWLKDELVELGPAFIKMGQFISTRADVLPKGINDELKKLQDDIRATPIDDIQAVLREEYGALYEQLFLRFDPEPIASASIGQVHRAVLADGNETVVVVKVQKPHVGDQIRTDLAILKNICRFFKLLNLNGRAAEIESLLNQYEDFLGGELDYLTEKDHMLFFKDQLEPVMPVVVPAPYPEYSTQRVLVMEDVPSVKITEGMADRLDAENAQLAVDLMDVFLYQIIYCGMVHCDPHPGNIGVDAMGRLVLYDFGNVADLGEEFRGNVRQLVVSVFQKDVDEFIELLLRMKILRVSDPMEVLELKNFFMYVFDYLERVDFQALRVSILENDLLKNSTMKVKIEPQFLSLFRVFSLLDGTCLKLDPSFSYLPALQPYVEDIVRDFEFMDYRMRRDIQKITDFPKTIQNTEMNLLKINRRMEQMSGQYKNIQWMVLGFAVVGLLDDPVKWLGVLPMVVFLFRVGL